MPEALQGSEVGKEGFCEGGLFDVGEVEFEGGLFEDAGDGWVVDVADVGEKVVFDLKVETADKVGAELAFCGEVGGGFELVDGPGVFDFALGVAEGELNLFDDVGELEDKRDEQAACKVQG